MPQVYEGGGVQLNEQRLGQSVCVTLFLLHR